LPLYFPPPVKIYLHHAIPLSVILSSPDTQEWFYSNYLQICNLPDNEPYPNEYFQFFPHNFSWDGNCFLDVQWWQYDEADTIIDFCRKWIKEGFYLDIDILESELMGKSGNEKNKHTHQCLIFGFDDMEKVLYSINFNDNFEFGIIKYSYHDFINAFRQVVSYLRQTGQYLKEKYSLRILKVNDRKFGIDIVSLKKLLTEYCFSIDSSKDLYYSIFFKRKKAHKHWGINVIHNLIDHIKNVDSNNTELDYRAFHGLWEHKTIMLNRMNYLIEKKIINADDEFIAKYKNMEHLASVVRFRIYKFYLTHNRQNLPIVAELLNEICTKEKSLIEETINRL